MSCVQGQRCDMCSTPLHFLCANKLFANKPTPRCPRANCGAPWSVLHQTYSNGKSNCLISTTVSYHFFIYFSSGHVAGGNVLRINFGLTENFLVVGKFLSENAKSGLIPPLLGNLRAKLNFWTAIIFSVRHLQLSFGKLQLPALPIHAAQH